jgi:hypothetical protein
MMKESTENFLRILNEQNARIAARESGKAPPEPDVDPIREQRQQERRDKWGQLRAREKSGKRPHKARSVFPRVDYT